MRIGLDFDGVITDTSKIKFETAKSMYGIEIPSKVFKEPLVVGQGLLTHVQYRTLMNTVCGTREVGFNMTFLNGAQKCIQDFLDGGHTVRVITSREGEELEVAREWCLERGLDLEFVSVGYGQDKVEAARDLDMYVEDDINKLKPLVGLVPHLFLVSWDYNEDADESGIAERVSSWDELNTYIENIIHGEKTEQKEN